MRTFYILKANDKDIYINYPYLSKEIDEMRRKWPIPQENVEMRV